MVNLDGDIDNIVNANQHYLVCRTLLLQLEEERKKLVEAINVTFGHLGQVCCALDNAVLRTHHSSGGGPGH